MRIPGYVIALDQGTTSSRAIIFDSDQNIVSSAQRELTQYYPRPGWVEHDPLEIYATQTGVMAEALAASGIPASKVSAIGITNQRETTIVWDKNTGRPLYNAIVWQCRRTADICGRLAEGGGAELIRKKTGLLPDAYFSASKIQWILDNVPEARAMAESGDAVFGTVDTWLLWKLTEGRAHITDCTNACRTMLYNIHEFDWDEELCALFNIPPRMLPKVCSSSEIYGTTNVLGVSVPIAGMAGDQHAALFGQACFSKGNIKNTYGTGCFMLMHTGGDPVDSEHGLLTTLAANTAGKKPEYALEGSIFIGGAVIQWLRDEMKLITESADSELFASMVPDNGGVYIVPAFTGLGAPYWDMYARGAILGLTRGTGRDHIIRAALESIAYQSRDVLTAMEKDAGIKIAELRVDGGASVNNLLMQFQADITGATVMRPKVRETTALGAACLAGLATGVWRGLETLKNKWAIDAAFGPNMPDAEVKRLCRGWARAVEYAKGWAEE